jgi:hypothetical protein
MAAMPGHLEIMMVFYGTQLPEFLVNLKAARGFLKWGVLMVATWSPDHDVIKWLRPARDKMAIISIASWLDGGCDVCKCSHDISVTIQRPFKKTCLQ